MLSFYIIFFLDKCISLPSLRDSKVSEFSDKFLRQYTALNRQIFIMTPCIYCKRIHDYILDKKSNSTYTISSITKPCIYKIHSNGKGSVIQPIISDFLPFSAISVKMCHSDICARGYRERGGGVSNKIYILE